MNKTVGDHFRHIIIISCIYKKKFLPSLTFLLIPCKEIARIDLILHIFQIIGKPVGHNDVAFLFECL